MTASKRSWSRRRADDGVSPVIGTILLVGITAVLAATLYIMSLGLIGSSGGVAPIGAITRSSIDDGFKWSFTTMSKETEWSEITVILSEGLNFTQFDNITTVSLHTNDLVTKCFGCKPLGPLSVFINVTDLGGDGKISSGDSFSLTTSNGVFSSIVSYEVTVLYRPTKDVIAGDVFKGS